MKNKMEKYTVTEITEYLDDLIKKGIDIFFKNCEVINILKNLERCLSRNTIELKLKEFGILYLPSIKELKKIQNFLSRNTIKTKLEKQGIKYAPNYCKGCHSKIKDNAKVSNVKFKQLLTPKIQKEIFDKTEKQTNKVKEELYKDLDNDFKE